MLPPNEVQTFCRKLGRGEVKKLRKKPLLPVLSRLVLSEELCSANPKKGFSDYTLSFFWRLRSGSSTLTSSELLACAFAVFESIGFAP